MPFDFVSKKLDGKSGRIIVIWDTSRFSNPHGLMGIVRVASERNATIFYSRGASLFNEFISSTGLSRIPLEGMRLARMNPTCNKLSKLDIFLVKTVNEEVQLQALVDGKKIIVTEASVRRDLQLNDEEGTDCLPNATIFEELTRMGYEKLSQKLTFYKAFFSPQWKFLIHTILQCLSAKTTAWNEFSSTMASAIICLATNQKFNFSKYIFESMVKNLDNASKFLMYPRFVQVFLDKQLEGMQSHKRIYVTPSHTKNIFGNIRRVGKGFSGRDTPLFPIMMVQAQQEQGEGLAMPTDPQHTPTIIQPSTSQPQKKQKPRKPKRKDTEVPQPSGPTTNVVDEAVNEEMDDSLEKAVTTATSLDAKQDRGNINKTQSKATLNEPSSLGTSLGLFYWDVTFCVIACVKKLEKKGGSRTHKLKRLYKVGRSARVISSDEASLGDQEDASKQGRKVDDIDKDAEVNDLEGDEVIIETEVASKDVNLTVDEVTLAQALAALKSAKPKADKVMLQEPEHGTITTTIVATTIKLNSIRPRLKGHDNVQGMIDADYQMAKQMQAEEQEKLSIKEKSKLFVQLLKARKKHFAAMRAQEMRNKPPTKAQKRNAMTTYLKNMAGYKQNQLKNKSFDDI
ncbi:hypothetical protein Tco_0806065 [Tanacetum coccineum]